LKIFLDSVGCRLNQSEIDRFALEIVRAGHDVVSAPDDADLAIINTCAVTQAAASDSRQKSRSAARAGAQQVILTGCWATIQPKAAASLPRVSLVRDNLSKDSLIEELLETSPDSHASIDPVPIPGVTVRTRAFIKVQDGCNNRCTFCVTTLARGRSRSYEIERVVELVRGALDAGHKEIVLTGVQLGAWGKDLQSRAHLQDLIKAILDRTEVPRLRLSSVEPWDLSADFFDLWHDGRLCPHLHLPLQSGSALLLRRMKRRTNPADFSKLAQAARAAIPNLALTTDIIVGFPGETGREFNESLRFVHELGFAGGHVFSYSPRPGTPAAAFPDQIPSGLVRERSARMREALASGELRYRKAQLGSEVQVLWEGAPERVKQGWLNRGWSRNHLRVQAASPSRRINQIDLVQLEKINGKSIHGSIVPRSQTDMSG
jgi:threonylcarbamoyladenosine tRNA methylthiotransferase MtaB